MLLVLSTASAALYVILSRRTADVRLAPGAAAMLRDKLRWLRLWRGGGRHLGVVQYALAFFLYLMAL
jgi:hypothetical protein